MAFLKNEKYREKKYFLNGTKFSILQFIDLKFYIKNVIIENKANLKDFGCVPSR